MAVILAAVFVAACGDDDEELPVLSVDESSPTSLSTALGPRIGDPPISATYEFLACGETQAPSPEWHSGVHTHGNGDIHIHAFNGSEEGPGARLVRWFEYGAGELTPESIRLPAHSRTWRNGDACPDSSEGRLQVFVNDTRLEDWSEYVPAEGDHIRLVFGPVPE